MSSKGLKLRRGADLLILSITDRLPREETV